MPEPATEPLALEATALRYAARTLSPAETTAFEARLADDQQARDALSEAVRLSAEALKQDSPSPSRGFRRFVRSRFESRTNPIAWVGLGAGIVAAASLLAVQVADRPAAADTAAAAAPVSTPAITPESPDPATNLTIQEESEAAIEAFDDMRKAAEIWAELSNTDHVEKTHDHEARMQQRFKNLRPAAGLDTREP